MIENIFDQLKRDEAIKSFPYKDTTGHLTIGVGRNLTSKGLSNDEINYLLKNDVANAELDVVKNLGWASALDHVRYFALVNLCFNMGINTLLKFDTFLNLFRIGNYEEAANDLGDTLWAKQVGDRAIRLAEQIRTGVWQ